MRFYSMPYREVMALPVRAFWFMSTQINRLAADEAVQALKVATSSHQPEAAMALQKDLITVVGEPVRVDVARAALLETRDEEGFAFLQSL